jgi:DNA (cytosine-5)-methyltransferase 1
VDTAKKLPTVLSFCSGYGGIERGLDLAGFKHRTVAYVEIEAYAIANLANKMEAEELLPAPIWSNLKTLPVQPFRDKVYLITGGYPCQPFSAAGQRKGTDDPRHLWPYIRKHIEAIRPVQCFFENVEGHISLGLREVIEDLEELGYRTTWGIFSAREVGAPHRRKRVYILAHSNGVRCDRGQLPDRVSQRSMEIEAQQRPEQPVVRSEVKGCSGDSGEVSDTKHIRVPIRHTEPCKQGNKRQANNADTPCSTLSHTISKSLEGHPNNGKSSVRNTEPHKWPPEPNVGRVVDGCADRVDRIRLLGNAVVPQTAAKAWISLNSRLNTTEGR